MRRHRRHRLSLRVDHDGNVTVSTCDECVDPAEALRILDRIRDHLAPLAEVSQPPTSSGVPLSAYRDAYDNPGGEG